MANEHNRLTGIPALSYKGVEATSPIQLVYDKKDPLPSDKKNFLIGSLWVNRLNGYIWILVSLANDTAIWVRLQTSLAQALYFQTQTGVSVPDITNTIYFPDGLLIATTNGGPNTVNINISNGADGQIALGLGGAGPVWGNLTSLAGSVAITPDLGGAGTINLEVANPNAITYQTDSGNAQALANILNIIGDGILITHGAGNTITIRSVAGPQVTTFHTDAGDAQPAIDVLNVYGAGILSTTGAGNTVNIILTRPVGRAQNDCSFMAYLDHAIPNATGDPIIRPIPANIKIFDTGNDYNNGTFTFVAPRTGYYYFCSGIYFTNVNLTALPNHRMSYVTTVINGATVGLWENPKIGGYMPNVIPTPTGNFSEESSMYLALHANDTLQISYLLWCNSNTPPYAHTVTVYGEVGSVYTYVGGYQVY